MNSMKIVDIKIKIAWFSGALLLIRKQVMQQIKGFDPDFLCTVKMKTLSTYQKLD